MPDAALPVDAAPADATALQSTLTPRQIVEALDQHIVGQTAAKRAVAIALRNRWRRRRVDADLREEIVPKNIILIGATGVGKTEIARRLAKLAQAPFTKVEASKFTEVGYVGRDVDSIIRDLVESAVRMVRQQEQERVREMAREHAEERLLDLLLPDSRPAADPADPEAKPAPAPSSRKRLQRMLRNGELAHREVEIDAEEKRVPSMQVFSGPGIEEMGTNLQEMLGQLVGRRSHKRRVRIPEALEALVQEEVEKLIDEDSVNKEALRRAEDSGIIFLDEIDKIARREGSSSHGPDVSREGVQRDILPIVEGSTVTTKYGTVKTDHMLFIAAGAFHVSKVSDLIPELQGRFPIRVELESLGEAELLRILREPQAALPVQYTALLKTEGIALEFTDTGLAAMAKVAAEANSRAENIGARRLHTVCERLLEEVSFAGPDFPEKALCIDAAYVEKALSKAVDQEDLTRYIL
jgi:ATP-dependent HslUV protease ATP-binding subunit HslU